MQYLRQFSEIFSGYSFRKQIGNVGSSSTGAIQFKDVDAHGECINYSGWSNLEEFPGGSKHYLQNGDILILTKGANNTAFIYEEVKSQFERAVASSAFTIIRTMTEYLDPAYVLWHLNSPETKESLKRLQVKTTVQNLSIETLQNLQMQIPPLNYQNVIGEVYLADNERRQVSEEREVKWRQLLHEKLKQLRDGKRRNNTK